MDHYLGGFNDCGDQVTFFQLELIRAAARDRTFDEVIPDTNHHVSHDVTKLDFIDFSAEFVSG